MNPVIANYVKAIPVISQLFLNDVGVVVSDCEQILAYKPGKTLDLKVPVGSPVRVGMAAYTAIHEKHRVVERKDASLWGVPFVVCSVPIQDETGEVIGMISVQENVAHYDLLAGMASKLSESVSLLAATTEQITAQSEEAAATCENMATVVRATKKQVDETDQIVGFIKSIAGQTNLLGLNAAIEAARVGDQGRGFGVVAQEIRKLATDSAESVNKIAGVIDDIQKSSEGLNGEITQVQKVVSEIANAISHVAGTIQEVGELADKIDKMMLQETVS